MNTAAPAVLVGTYPPGPEIPTIAQVTLDSPICRRSHLLAPGEWEALGAGARAHRVDHSVVPFAIFVEVVRRWSNSARFTIGYRAGWPAAGIGPDGLGPRRSLVAVPEPEGTVATRAQALADRLRAGGEDFAAHSPVVVTDQRGGVAGATGTDPEPAGPAVWELVITDQAAGVRLDWLSRDAALPDGLAGNAFEAYLRALATLAGNQAAWSARGVVTLPEDQLDRLGRVNATAAEVPDGLLHTPLVAHAADRPDEPAVITPGQRLSFGELSARVNRVAHRLRALGAGPNRLVAVVMEKGWEQVVGLHAALTAGAAYLPIDPQVPPERLRQLLGHGDVETVLTQSWLEPRLSWPSRVRRLLVDRESTDGPTGPLAPVQRPTDLAYVIPTSGSTGVPKGVMVDHRGALNALTYLNRRFGVGPGDRCFAVSAVQFDISVYDHFGVLAAGGALVVPDFTPRPDPAGWARLIDTAGVTMWNSVPAFLEMVVAQLERQPNGPHLRRLRLAILGGDFIPLTLPDRLRALNARVRLVNGGGPAESCVYSIMYEIGNVDPSWKAIPYGRPVANQRYYVLDEASEPCPTWVAGEIHIVSEVGLAQGYWHDPAQTRQRFRHRPEVGGRTYQTGDIGRYLPSGDIELLGRKDFQVKLQGVRVELGELEAAIAGQPEVAATAVVPVAPRGREVVALRAYVVWRDGRTEQPDRLAALRTRLAEVLPPYLVPASMVELDQLPLTPNGKVDRLALAGRRGLADNPVTPVSLLDYSG